MKHVKTALEEFSNTIIIGKLWLSHETKDLDTALYGCSEAKRVATKVMSRFEMLSEFKSSFATPSIQPMSATSLRMRQ